MTEELAVHLPDTAEGLRQAIYSELGELIPHEVALDRSYIRLGSLLVAFKKGECWRKLNYPNFEAFLNELSANFHRGRTQLYQYISTAENLLPLISEATLDKIGITKAQELRRALAESGRELTKELIDAAINENTSTKELRALIHSTYNIKDDIRPVGTWLDLGGFYATDEERAEFEEAIKVGEAVLNLKKETADWIKRKETILNALREFLGAHSHEVYGPRDEE